MENKISKDVSYMHMVLAHIITPKSTDVDKVEKLENENGSKIDTFKKRIRSLEENQSPQKCSIFM